MLKSIQLYLFWLDISQFIIPYVSCFIYPSGLLQYKALVLFTTQKKIRAKIKSN